MTAIACVLLAACGTSHGPDAGADAMIADTGPDTGPPPDGSVGPLPETCLIGTAIPCPCPDAPDGFLFCLEGDGVFGECECGPPMPPGPDGGPDAGLDGGPDGAPDGGMDLDGSVAPDASVGTCVPGDEEWCDGRDNDCDGVIDNGHVCPDATVRNTVPHDFVVWMHGRRDTRDGALQRLWPEYGGATFSVDAYLLQFDRNGSLVFQGTSGVRRYTEGGGSVELPTPPCFDGAALIGFDETNQMYYRCNGIRRGEGELVAEDGFTGIINGHVRDLLSSRRVLVHDANHGWSALYETDATLVSELPSAEWVGEMELIYFSSTVTDGHAFMALNRTYRGRTRREIVIYRVDTDGRWSLVRRIPTPVAMEKGLALPDGNFIGLRTGVAFIFPPSGPVREIRDAGPEHELQFVVGGWQNLVAGPPSF